MGSAYRMITVIASTKDGAIRNGSQDTTTKQVGCSNKAVEQLEQLAWEWQYPPGLFIL